MHLRSIHLPDRVRAVKDSSGTSVERCGKQLDAALEGFHLDPIQFRGFHFGELWNCRRNCATHFD
jgi:hypothetical protein